MMTIDDTLDSVHNDLITLERSNAIAVDFIGCPPRNTWTFKERVVYVATSEISELLLDLYSEMIVFPKIRTQPVYHPEIEAAIKRHRIHIDYRVYYGKAVYGILSETGNIILYTFDRICLFHQLAHYSRCFLLKTGASSFNAEEELIAELSALVLFKYLYKFNYAYIGNSIEYINKNVSKYLAETSANRSMDKAQALQNIYPKVLSCVKALLCE